MLIIGCSSTHNMNAQPQKSSPLIKVGVFCSSDNKVSEKFKVLANNLGKKLNAEGFGIITGALKTGLMKEVVDGYTSHKPAEHAYGVMITSSKTPYPHPSIPKNNLAWKDTMHERLATFHQDCNAIIVLPGGFGTLHELMDFLVHKQIGCLDIPIIVLNIDGFWNYQLKQFEKMVEEKCLAPKNLKSIIAVDSLDSCIKAIENSYVTKANKQ